MNLDLKEIHQSIINQTGHMLVKGGPGSGKTTIALLKAKARCKGLEPGQGILFLSFSRAAIRQILGRSQDLLKNEERRLIQVKTYHLFCREILRGHGRLLGGFPTRILTPKGERLKKSFFEGDWEAEQVRLAQVEGIYCFDQFAKGAAMIVAESEAVRSMYGDRFPLIIVDEFQDTDEDQWRLIKSLASVTDVVCLADPEQCIFDYRPTVSFQRINSARVTLGFAEFDLGKVNHRSPQAGILSFADAVLNNEELPKTSNVKIVQYYWPNGFDSVFHAAVHFTIALLRKKGIHNPCVAVLTKSNRHVAQLSAILQDTHVYKKREIKPIPHDVVWDANLSASSAEIVGSILEWRTEFDARTVSDTLACLSRYFRLKNAEQHSKVASKLTRQFAEASEAVIMGRLPRIQAARNMVEIASNGIEYRGDPVSDWRSARDILRVHKVINDVFRSASMVRLFQATDVLSKALSELWLESGSYIEATATIRKVLNHELLLALERDPQGCVLMNLHKCKGKEFDGVVIVEGKFESRFFDEKREHPPYNRSRRLLRVGITRARNLVTIVRPQGANQLTQR